MSRAKQVDAPPHPLCVCGEPVTAYVSSGGRTEVDKPVIVLVWKHANRRLDQLHAAVLSDPS